jgi:predicted ATPase
LNDAVLTRLAIENFKRFRALSLPLRPLTVLTGINGGGKTTVIQALLLARLASRGPTSLRSVQLNGPYGLSLGDAADVLHADAGEGEAIRVRVERDGLMRTWEFQGTDDRGLNLSVRAPSDAPPPFSGPEREFLYLCAERWGPRDVQGMSSAEVADLHPGHQGEFVAQVLAMLDAQVVRQALLHPRAFESESPIVTLRQNVEWWLSSIVCPVTLSATTVLQTSVAVLRYGIPGRPLTHVRPPNGGFGVTYALPVLVAALMAPRGALLLVENPEAHLHPAGQSAIGSFLARLAGDGVQVIVETHSDHVINGMRRAVGSEECLTAEDAVIHFFSAPSGSEAAVTSITPRANGELSAWPRGFFDQMDDDLAALAKVRRRGR